MIRILTQPRDTRRVAVDVALGDDDRISHALLTTLGTALRADSPDAPSTRAEAMARGIIWTKAEEKELGNHAKNESWVAITRDELPPGRRVHKLIWVYKMKRDGTAKARLCVQGTTLEEGVDTGEGVRWSADGRRAWELRGECEAQDCHG